MFHTYLLKICYFLCVLVFVSECVYGPLACLVPWGPQVGMSFPGTGVYDGYGQPVTWVLRTQSRSSAGAANAPNH